MRIAFPCPHCGEAVELNLRLDKEKIKERGLLEGAPSPSPTPLSSPPPISSPKGNRKETPGDLSHAPAHAREEAGTQYAVVLAPFAFGGMQKPTHIGSTAPLTVKVNDGGWEWAQGQGWRGDRAGLQRTAEECLDYYHGTGKRMKDWPATLRNWIRRTIRHGEDVVTIGQSPVLAGPTGGTNVNGQGQRQEARYGYNSKGEPTNRATNMVQTARELAEWNAERLRAAGEEADGNVISLSDDEWRSR